MQNKKLAVTAQEASELYGIAKGSLANLRYQKKGPKYFIVNKRKVLYRVADLEAWLYQNPVQTIDSFNDK